MSPCTRGHWLYIFLIFSGQSPLPTEHQLEPEMKTVSTQIVSLMAYASEAAISFDGLGFVFIFFSAVTRPFRFSKGRCT